MKNSILKIGVILLVILSMTMTNFIFVGKGLISYAADSASTNNPNVEFEAYFKDEDGKKITTLERENNQEEISLYINVNVKKEGYFNGEISLENSNFTLKSSDSEYVNKISNNTIYLNQINLGAMKEIEVKIEPIKSEYFEIGLLDSVSKLNLKGIYRDSNEKDIEIKASRELNLKLIENNTENSVMNEMKMITNKTVQIEEQEKRVIQFLYNMGLKENNYPIKEINSIVAVPTINNNQPNVVAVSHFNNMNKFKYKYDGDNIEITFQNEASSDGRINWKKNGTDDVIITLIYDANINVADVELTSNQEITLYNEKTIDSTNTVKANDEEIDSVIQVESNNSEEYIYKGKLYAGIPREYQSQTRLNVNYARIISNIEVIEEASRYITENGETSANVIYNRTSIRKQDFDKIFGEEGTLTICNKQGETLGTVTSTSEVDEQGNVNISYEGKNITEIVIKATNPIKEGILKLNHTKTIQESSNIVTNATELKNKITAQYNENSIKKESENTLQLKETSTEAILELNRQDLSTVVSNNIEMKVILLSNHEKYDLYTNPKIVLQLPEQVESVAINNVDLLYGNGINIKNYEINGRNINVYFEGTQTQYNEDTVLGSTLTINATININKKSATSDNQIKLVYSNGEKSGETVKPIKIVAPKDLTTIYSIPELGIETMGQEETTTIMIPKGEPSKQLEAQIEIINNNENNVENVKVLGDFPTNNDVNNMGIKIANAITLQGVENAKVYYSENANATDDLENAQNGWSETINNNSTVKKYLITVESIAAQSIMKATYTYVIPANLEYNQLIRTGYKVKIVDSATKVESELASTVIEMQTGIGPEIKTKLLATKQGETINTPVKNGEVIKYDIEVSNTGTEDIANLVVRGQVPEGTVLVEPVEEYEYAGTEYYKELENKTYEKTIENLKVGETVHITYEVRVKNDTEPGTKLTNFGEILYGEAKKQTDEIQNVTAKGDIRITLKRVTDREEPLYTKSIVEYTAIIENISGKKQENLKAVTSFPDGMSISNLRLCEIDGENVNEKEIEYSKEIDIGTLEANQIKTLNYVFVVEKDNLPITISVDVKQGEETYKSNQWQDNTNKVEVGLSMASATEGEYVKAGDIIQYNIAIQNKTAADIQLTVTDTIPEQLSVTDVIINGEKMENSLKAAEEGQEESTYYNDLNMSVHLEANETKNIEIQANVDYSEERDEAEPITNIASAQFAGETIATTTSVNHIIMSNQSSNVKPDNQGEPVDGSEEQGGESQNPSQNGENNNIEDNNFAKGYKTISGIAWYDENRNGQKDQGEQLLKDIKVKLLNTETNNLVKNESGTVLEATTNSNGIYILDKIGNGKYIAIFEYNSTQYGLTKYKATGISDAQNSDVSLNELLIENDRKQVASTDILTINDDNISNINIGLVKLQNFDLELDKYVNKVLIQNASGSTVLGFSEETLAKAEIPGKYLNGSTVIIEYSIKVTNKGEVDGYAKKIADYIPADLSFSSELNKNWYQVGNTLYTNSLENEKIKSGESKTVTLTLTKTMTENNTGSIPNIAEIVESYNELGLADSNSTPGNRDKSENDYSQAETIISVKTGEIVYTGLIIAAIVILGIVIFIIVLKKKNDVDIDMDI